MPARPSAYTQTTCELADAAGATTYGAVAVPAQAPAPIESEPTPLRVAATDFVLADSRQYVILQLGLP